MRLRRADGETIGGTQAVVYLARRVCWAWPLWAMSQIPGVMGLLERGYRLLAARRHCQLRAHERRRLRTLTRSWS